MIDQAQFRNFGLPRHIPAINLLHLRYAVTSEDEGSFRGAAGVLLVRQSTLSRRIRELERSIGMRVFDRSSAGISATPSGQGFLRHARSILAQIDSLVMASLKTGRGEVGRLSIGCYTSLSAGNLRASLIDFRQRFPDIKLGVIESSRSRLMTELRTGALDVVFVTGESRNRESEGNVLSLWTERTLIALPDHHPLADRKTVYWTDLRGETVLLSQNDRGCEFEALLASKLLVSEGRPSIERHDTSSSMIQCLVSLGTGVSLVTESDAGTHFSGLIYRELRDGTGPACVGYSAHWKADNDNPALANLLKLLSERYPLPADGI